MKTSISTLALALSLAVASNNAIAQDADADSAPSPTPGGMMQGGMMQKDVHPMMVDCHAMMSNMLDRMESEQMQGDMRDMISAMGPRMQRCHEMMSGMLGNRGAGAAEQKQ